MPKDETKQQGQSAEHRQDAAQGKGSETRQAAAAGDHGVSVEHKREGVGEGGYAPADPRSQHEQATQSYMPVRDSVTGEPVAPPPKMSGNSREASQKAAEQVHARTGTVDGSGLPRDEGQK